MYASAPIIFATGIYAHIRYPTKLGWLVIAFLLLTPSIIGTISGITYVYLGIGVKYSWQTLFNVLLLDIALFLALFVFLHFAKVSETDLSDR